MQELATIKSKSTPPAMPAPESTDKPKPKAPDLRRSDKVLRDQVANVWRLLVPADTKPEDYLDPGALGAASVDLHVYDRIEALSRDEKWWAEYLVTDTGPGWATLILLRAIELPKRKDGAEARVPAGHRIYRGATDEGWIVYRDTDGVTMSNGHRDHETALRWLLDHATMRRR